MVTVICTLYEGSYAIGLGALINSLYKHNFKGNFYIGYKGDLPKWLNSSPITKINNSTYEYNGNKIQFIELDTERHLTNYKPEFMRLVLQKYETNTEAIFYFDPDICVKCDWSFFERWANHGVALCEDINSPMPISHPIRKDWEAIFLKTKFVLDTYFNGGFIGLVKSNFSFLENWAYNQTIMENHIGNLKNWGIKDRTYIFEKTDQDALNITAQEINFNHKLSVIGKEAMDFIEGGYIMSHALGQPKPWNKNFIIRALKGVKISKADLEFHNNVKSPLQIYNPNKILRIKSSISISKFLNKLIK